MPEGYNNGCMDSKCKRVMTVDLPLSKSIAARLLILDYIYGRGMRGNLPDCDDSRELSKALGKLRENPGGGSFDLGTGATSLRFFIALVAGLPGFEGTIDCSAQLRVRPLSPLVEALRKLGADIRYQKEEGRCPLYIKGKKLCGGELSIDGSVSSQFISALMLISPLCENPLELKIEGDAVSMPYIVMTQRLIDSYSPEIGIEPDWSAAAFFYEMLLTGVADEIRIERITDDSLSVQGDAGCRKIYDSLGVDTIYNADGSATLLRVDNGDKELKNNADRVDSENIGHKPEGERPCNQEDESLKIFDLGNMPDLVPSLAVAMTFAGIPFRIDNISHLQYKESDRLHAIISNLKKFGFRLHTDGSALWWRGERGEREERGNREERRERGERGERREREEIEETGDGFNGNEILIESHDDHRIAMAFAPALSLFGNVRIDNKTCVSKSFPGFWDEIKTEEETVL